MKAALKRQYVVGVAVLALLSLGGATHAGDRNQNGVDDGIAFVDVNGDGCNDGASGIQSPELGSQDVLVISRSRPLAFFGFYRATQMTEPGWTLLRRTIDWADGHLSPHDTRILLFTYNNDLEWPVTYQQEDGYRVYTFLRNQGFNVTGHHQWDMPDLEPAYYRDFDLIIYWNSYSYDPAKALASGVPFISSGVLHGWRMNLLRGWFQSRLETFCLSSTAHYPTETFTPRGVSFERDMWVRGGEASGEGVSLISEVCFTTPLDIKPGACPNPLNATAYLTRRSNRKQTNAGVIRIALPGAAALDVSEVDVSTLLLQRTGPESFHYADVCTAVEAGDGCNPGTARPDGRADLVLRFRTSDLLRRFGYVDPGDVVPVTLSGQLLDGAPFYATDSVVIVGGGKPESVAAATVAMDAGLRPPVPNPFNPVTTIRYHLQSESYVELAVYDAMGGLVETLVADVESAGEHAVSWDAGSAPSGVYFCRLKAEGVYQTQKLVLTK